MMRKRVEDESPLGPERDIILRTLKTMEDAFFTMQFVYDNVPQPKVEKCLDVILAAAKLHPTNWRGFVSRLKV